MRTFRTLCLALACFSAAHAKTTFSNKTFLRVRDALDFLSPVQRAYSSDTKHTWNVCATAYHRSAYNKKELGIYFGPGLKEADTLDPMFVFFDEDSAPIDTTDSSTSAEIAKEIQIHNDYFSTAHTNVIPGSTLGHGGIMSITPSYSEHGMLLECSRYLPALRATLSISTPVVSIQTDMNPIIRESSYRVAPFFAGQLTDYDVEEYQDYLKYLKISVASPRTTHIGDVLLKLSKQVGHNFKYGASAIIPVAARSKNEYLFSPQAGNGMHPGLGLFVTSCHQIYSSEESLVTCNVHADYRYLLRGTETRTLGLYNFRLKRFVAGGHYRQLIKNKGNQYHPGANILTMPVAVTPGSQFTGEASLTLRKKTVSLNLGYTLFARQEEDLSLSTNNAWNGRLYGLARLGPESNEIDSGDGNIVGHLEATVGGFINAPGDITTNITIDGDDNAVEPLNTSSHYAALESCTSPADVTHTLSGSIGWHLDNATLKNNHHTIALSSQIQCGGCIELSGTDSNHGMRSWSTWLKLSLAF